jgi:hypothetical protein
LQILLPTIYSKDSIIWLASGFVTRLIRRVPLLEQELLTLLKQLSSSPVFSGVRVTRSLVLCVCFLDRCSSFCTFPFGHCVVCSSSIYGFWLPLWYLQALLIYKKQIIKWKTKYTTLSEQLQILIGKSSKQAIYTSYTLFINIHDRSLSWLGTGTSIKRGGVKLYYDPNSPLLVKWCCHAGVIGMRVICWFLL